MIKPITWCFDVPDKRDFPFSEFEGFIEWLPVDKKRPYNDIVKFNQENLPACTRYALMHINNAQNFLEYKENWLPYVQIDPKDERAKWNQVKSLQAALAQAKKEWLITWYLVLDWDTPEKLIEQTRKAISLWMYVYTGSDNCNWSETGKTGLYTVTTKSAVWHARPIIDFTDDARLFHELNSRWADWWPKWWYFDLKYEDIDKTFTRYAIIDKDDSGKFDWFKRQQKAEQFVRLAKELRAKETELSHQEALNNAANAMRESYKFTDKNL